MSDTEQYPSGRLLINDDLSDLTRTPEVIEQHILRRFSDEQQARELFAIDQQRQRTFERYVGEFNFKEVDRRRLQRYISTGKTDEGFVGVGVAHARAHIRNVVRLLRTHEHYHLALSDQSFETNFALKPGYAVLWERRAENGEGRIAGVVTGIRDTEPATVAEFEHRFELAWSAVPPIFRDKHHVIAWLERDWPRLKPACPKHSTTSSLSNRSAAHETSAGVFKPVGADSYLHVVRPIMVPEGFINVLFPQATEVAFVPVAEGLRMLFAKRVTV